MLKRRLKGFLSGLGVYRPLRWARRQLFRREELQEQQVESGVYSEFVKPGDIVFDVGANVGDKTRLFSGLNARVVAFEPQPDCRDELRMRCGSNPRLTILDQAAGAEPGVATLFVRQHRGASGLVRNWASTNSIVEKEIQVEVTTLDRAIDRHGVPAFVKIDVEGYEDEVLKGLSRRVGCVSFEFHLLNSDRERNESDIGKVLACIDLLSTLGRIEVNLSPAKRMRMVYSRWLSEDEFRSRYLAIDAKKLDSAPKPNSLSEAYGDVFVRIHES